MILTYPGDGQLTCTLYRDDWINIAISGAAFLVGLLIMFLFWDDYEITCQNKAHNLAAQCILTNRFFNINTTIIDLGQLQNAKVVSRTKVVSTKRSSGQNTLYSVILITNKGAIKMSRSSSSSYSTHLKQAEAINQYILSSDKKQFSVPHFYDLSFFVVFFIIFLCIYGGIYRLLRINLILIFNKNKNSLVIRKKNILKLNETHFALPDIQEVIIEKQKANKWMSFVFLFLNFNKNKPPQDNHLKLPSNIKIKQGAFKTIVDQDNKLLTEKALYRFVLVFKHGELLVLTRYLPEAFFLPRVINQINLFIKGK